ncbi:MAG: FHA domain-containing protein [Anaerolineae bacterium]|nr:FHA domain-containing protein [Anaerolineae bacterium]
MSNNKQQKAPVVCPHCDHVNLPDATHCAKCGRQLLLTVPMPDTANLAKVQLSRGIPDAEGVSLMADTLAFLIPGFTDPLHVEQTDTMILGRQVPNEAAPEIDLTIYNAYAMGVSRRHALIRSSPDGYTIEDLGSANGTWVNENRLPPHKPHALGSGDQIRIGHLVLFVYFKAMMSIFLVDTGAPLVRRRKLTPHFLANHVSPYLRALAEVQFVVDDILERAPSEVALHTISVSSNGVLNVRLEKVADAIQLVKEVIQPWTAAYIDGAEIIRTPTPLATEPPPDKNEKATQEQDVRKTDAQDAVQPEDKQSDQGKTAPPLSLENDQRRTTQEIVREAALDLLINQVINHIKPRLPERDKAAYAEKLRVSLPVLVTSTLELSDVPVEPKE